MQKTLIDYDYNMEKKIVNRKMEIFIEKGN